MDFYAIYGDLLIQSLNWNNQLLNETLQYMINHKLGHKLSLEKYYQILIIFEIKLK